jgi:hypothetical protein
MRNVHLIFTERNLIVILLYISVMMMLIKQEETITKRASLWLWKGRSYCSTSGTHRGTLVANHAR